MPSWQIYKYGDINELTLSRKRYLPVIEHPQDVLIRVEAASINPIDSLIMGRYLS